MVRESFVLVGTTTHGIWMAIHPLLANSVLHHSEYHSSGDNEMSDPIPHVICHCGKCQVKCNKHGKRAKCADCGKVRMLGTIVKNGKMRHCCDECCQKANEEAERVQNEMLMKALRAPENVEEDSNSPT